MDRFTHWFFDFDGTLCDTEPDIIGAWERAFERGGIRCPDFRKRFKTGPTLQETIRLIFPEASADECRQFGEAFKVAYDTSGFPHSVPYPGIEAWLTRLREAGKRLAIVTNKRRKPLLMLLEKLGWNPYFDGLYTVDTFPDRKMTKNEVLAVALREMEAPAAVSVMVGDTVPDITAGQVNGIATAAVLWGYGAADALRAAHPDFLCSCPMDVGGKEGLND
ncbi:MAG: HAD family hydrolase [Kiritimatiellae bacterium]|nr:HAD family hydrolase [Kiritimatiellia bacterium]